MLKRRQTLAATAINQKSVSGYTIDENSDTDSES